MKTITLTTDFGLLKANVAVMKGVIWKIAPEVEIADLSHLIEPQNILQGAQILGRAGDYFPAGTIHVAVVDPGVGTARRSIAARLGDRFFVGPDNGLITFLLKTAREHGEKIEIIHLNEKKFWLEEVSATFHGRDIFAPVAAHLANGVSITEMGSLLTDPILVRLSQPQSINKGWQGEVTHIDHFGNLGTNILRSHLGENQVQEVQIGEEKISGLVRTFGDQPPGSLVALIDSSDEIAISVVNGSAAQRLNAHLGDIVKIILK